MNYATIKYTDVANGPGVRVSLYVSGCTRHCPGCFNPETWDFAYGEEFTAETEQKILDALAKPYIKGFSLLGGEPFEYENQKALVPFLKKLKAAYPEKEIWCYSGCSFEKEIKGQMLTKWPETKELLAYIDVLVDGEFIEAEKNPNLRFKGSANQHIILVQPSLAQDKLVLWTGEEKIESLKPGEAATGLSQKPDCDC
jgi:anaerobic ribonucleoside-triphosphate reductase activating protein